MAKRKLIPFRPTDETAQILRTAAERCDLSLSNVLEVLVRQHAPTLRPRKIDPSHLPARSGAGRKNSKKS